MIAIKRVICLLFGHKPFIWNERPVTPGFLYGPYGPPAPGPMVIQYAHAEKPELKIGVALCTRCREGHWHTEWTV